MELSHSAPPAFVLIDALMEPEKKPRFFGRSHWSRFLAPVFFTALLFHAVSATGWTRVFGELSTEGLRVLICTPDGAVFVTLDADGRPIETP